MYIGNVKDNWRPAKRFAVIVSYTCLQILLRDDRYGGNDPTYGEHANKAEILNAYTVYCVVQMWLLGLRMMMKEQGVSTSITAQAAASKKNLLRFSTIPSLLSNIHLIASLEAYSEVQSFLRTYSIAHIFLSPPGAERK